MNRCDYPGCHQLATILCGYVGCTHQVCEIHGNCASEETPDHPPVAICWDCGGKGWGKMSDTKTQKQMVCFYRGCTKTENLYDLTPFNAPEQEISVCDEHYNLVARELLDDGYILDSPSYE